MQQIVRTLTMAEAGVAGVLQVLICDRDRKWSRDVRRGLQDAGIRVVLIPARAPNANAYAERFVRSIKEECLDRLIPIGEQHFRRAVPSTSSTITENGITRASGIDSSRARRSSTGRVAYGGTRGSAGSSTSTSGRRDREVGRALEHYGHRRFMAVCDAGCSGRPCVRLPGPSPASTHGRRVARATLCHLGSRSAAASPGPFREKSRDVVASPSCAAFLDVLSPASRQVVLPQHARDVPRQAFGLAPSREGQFAVLPDDHLPPEAVARLVAQLARHDMVVADQAPHVLTPRSWRRRRRFPRAGRRRIPRFVSQRHFHLLLSPR